MKAPRYPLLYQINTRVWLTELSQALGRASSTRGSSLGERNGSRPPCAAARTRPSSR